MAGLVQKIRKSYTSKLEFASTYYAIITKLNRIALTPTEMKLLCHCAVNGTISSPPIRDAFIKEYKVPKGTVYNMTAKLQKMGILVKVNSKVRVNPVIQIDFTQPFYKLEVIMFNDKEA